VFISLTNLNLVFTLHNYEFAWDELLLLGFYHFYFYFYNFRDAPLRWDPNVPLSYMNFPKILGVSPHAPHVCFPGPVLPYPGNLVEHCIDCCFWVKG